jgi:hypothetical protein
MESFCHPTGRCPCRQKAYSSCCFCFYHPTACSGYCPNHCPADYIDDQNHDHIDQNRDHSHRAVDHGDNHLVVAVLQAVVRGRLRGDLLQRPVLLEQALMPGVVALPEAEAPEQTALQFFPASAGNENPRR